MALFPVWSIFCQGYPPLEGCPTVLQVLDAESGLPVPHFGFQHIRYRQKVYSYSPSENLQADENGRVCLGDGWTDWDTLWVGTPFYKQQKIPVHRIRQSGYRVFVRPEFDDYFPYRALPEMNPSDTFSTTLRSLRISSLQPGPQLTVGDYWRQSGQVQVSRTLYAGGLPTFQGLGVNQAALLIDGIPVNPGWLGNRNDHGGLLPTVGIVTLDILAAPTSVLYGGNAQGGVLGYTTFGPAQFENAREGLHGYVQGRYFSQWKGLGEEGVLEYQSGDFYSKTSIGHAQVGDFDWGRQGIGTEEEKLAPLFHPINGWQSDSLVPNLQPHTALGTGFKRWEVNQGLLLRSLGPLWNLYGQFQYASLPQQTQTARTLLADSNGTPVFADWRFVDRDRRMFAGGFELPVETQLFNHAFFKVSHQSWRENAQFRRLGDTLQSYYFDRLNQLDLRLDLVNMILGKQVIYYGFRYRQDQSESRAYGLSLANRNPILIPNWRPDGGGRMRQWGIYYHQVFDLSIGAKAWLGVSYDRSLLQVTYQRAAEWPWLPIEYSLPNNAVSGCAGVHVKAGSGWDWQVDASSGFRTLNLEDASAVYGSQRGIPISPNSALFPSYVWQGQMVIGHQMGLKDRVEGALFYRRIMDGFALGESPWEGQDSIDFMGQYSAIQSLQNSVEAHQVGLRLGGNIPMGKHWMANFSLHSLYQRTAEIGGHGGFFPAFGKAELVWDWKRVSARANILFSSRGGNQGNVLGWEGGGIGAGAGYWVPSLSVTYSPFSWLVVNLSAENITDTRYRMAQSRFYEPGRNMGAGLRIQF